MTDDTFTAQLVERLQKELRPIKAAQTRLRKRVQGLEIMGFQDQLNALDEKVDRLSDSLLLVRRHVSKVSMRSHLLGIQEFIHETWRQNPAQAIAKQYDRCLRDIREDSALFQGALGSANSPEVLIDEFLDKAKATMTAYGLGSYFRH